MKPLVLIAAGLVTLAIAGEALAQSRSTQQTPTTQPTVGRNFVDADGDGICDNYQARAGAKRGRGYGPGDGTGNRGIGPRDGTGYGARAGAGRPGPCGQCDGTGPKGPGPRWRR